MKGHQPNRAEKCGICFFVNNKAIFTLVKTKNPEVYNDLLKFTYLEDEPKRK